MPYPDTGALPPAVRRLPPHAQHIFLAAFNSAWQAYAGYGPLEQEQTAFRIAWAAVKRRYRKAGERWVECEAAQRVG